MSGYIPNTDADRQKMFEAMGIVGFDDLLQSIPQDLRLKKQMNLTGPLTQRQLLSHMQDLSSKNKVYEDIYCGAGAYNHFVPPVVAHLATREEFLTAYTPYQPEISQGVLQAIFEYQTMICELTGMDASNASVYDGATAAAEAVSMCVDKKRNRVIVPSTVSPETIEVLKTWHKHSNAIIDVVDVHGYSDSVLFLSNLLDDQCAAVVMQCPNYFGAITDMQSIADTVHQAGAKLISCVNPMSLGLLKSPGEYGADIAVGDCQPFGMPLAFGGPYQGFMACTEKLMRKLPGRIVGQAYDHEGRRGFVLTMQAREQHIRREKASSNICSNQALNALTTAVYLSSLGPQGLNEVAKLCYENAHYLRDRLEEIDGFSCMEEPFFNEFTILTEYHADDVLDLLDEYGILGGFKLNGNSMLWCATELNSKEAIDRLIVILEENFL